MPLICAALSELAFCAPVEPKPDAAQIEFFEKKIRPVLVSKCYDCHSQEDGTTKGELALDTREGAREGGSRGPAVVPGNLNESILIRAIRYNNDKFAMPPRKNGGKLPPEVIADFEEWVKLGAPDPRDKPVTIADVPAVPAQKFDLQKAREFWAFQQPKASTPPKVADRDWPRTNLDRFVLAALESKGLKPVEDADRQALLRRVSYDLTGLPPSPEQIRAFADDPSSDALERLVDHLLESPRFGERWGRFWLDVARYGESSGKDRNITFPYAWKYRDYVIDAFNADKPYDQFIKEQIAGDLIPSRNEAERDAHLIATGFLAVGPKGLNETRPKYFKWDIVDEQIDVTSRAVLGLTASCARCHDHKFDPIPTRDYHALAGIFSSTETRYGTVGGGGNRRPGALVALAGAPELPIQFNRNARIPNVVNGPDAANNGTAVLDPAVNLTGSEPAMMNAAIGGTSESDPVPAPVRRRAAGLVNRDPNARKPATGSYAMGVREANPVADSPIYLRGDLATASEVVPRGFLQVLTYGEPPKIDSEHSGRLELADWLTDPRNPLTARVLVNRVWQHLLGEGIVSTADNFGKTGARPNNQELLDYLAVGFVSDNWSVKRLIRSIVLSRVYQLSTKIDEHNYAVDPANTLLWRSSPRRLDAESIRDSILAASGRLDIVPPHGSLVAELGDGYIGASIKEKEFKVDSKKRSVYLPIVRDLVPEALSIFDFAEPSMVVARRESTSVPTQALFLMNNPFVLKEAEATAKRLLHDSSEEDRISAAYLTLLSRLPTEVEEVRIKEFIRQQQSPSEVGSATLESAWALVCQALFASAEFRYLK